MSGYTFRLVTTPGIEHVLIKELKMLGLKNPQKLKGRKIVQATGTLKDLYKVCYKSRVADSIQLRMTRPFLARGEKELNKNLAKLPWHAYLPLEEFRKYRFPIIKAKSFKSKLYHTRKISDILKLHLNELPIRKLYNKQNRDQSYKSFKREYKKYLKENNQVTQFRDNVPRIAEADSIDNYRTKILNTVKQTQLKKLGYINIIINNNKAEILLDTSYDSLYKHGYRNFENEDSTQMTHQNSGRKVPGIIRETLASASILDSGTYFSNSLF